MNNNSNRIYEFETKRKYQAINTIETETFAETAYIIVLFKADYGTVRNGWLDTGSYTE